MKKIEILKIAKQLIMIAGKYSKVDNLNEKNKIKNKFSKYEKQLKNDNTKYSKTILSFLFDLRDDLNSGRELNIDSLSTDEYLENYLVTKRELKYYNSLILEDSYRIIFDELNASVLNNDIINNNLEKIKINYLDNIKKINTKNIAKNLLIFTSFERKIPKKYLLNLYNFLKNSKQKQVVLELLKILEKLIKETKNYGIEFYKKNNFNYKYIGFKNINGKSILADHIIDTSKIHHRTAKPKKEYIELLRKL